METYQLEAVPGVGDVHVACFTDVKNAAVLKERFQAQDKTMTFAMVESNLVMDVFQLLLASTKAAKDNESGKLSTQSLSSEIVYNLSPSKNIAESFKRFGIKEQTTSLVAVKIGGQPDEVQEEMSNMIEGNITSFSKLDQEKDITRLRQFYKIDPKVTDDTAILNWIIGSMAMKHIM
ncbi:kinase binding protein CGI-121-domain-containing protein [Mortierella sp. GBAus27b]|nr:hypothetical protein BGX31_003444 [Mortierella sp. GBA43]KAI8358682.1 kinase binding protein CGI-121-domain-containing protein [Mortierella sp. GBAus27b]